MSNNCELCNGFEAMMRLYDSGMDMDEAFHVIVDSMLEEEADALSQDLYDLGYKHGIADMMVDAYGMLCGTKHLLRKTETVSATAIQCNKQIIHHIRFCRTTRTFCIL